MNLDSTATIQTIKVLVSDYTRLGSDLILSTLSFHTEFQASSCEAEADRFVANLRALRPDVVLIGANSNGAGLRAIELVRIARAALPTMFAIVMMETASHELAVDAFRAGARGVFCREDSADELVTCLQHVYAGKVWAKSNHLLHVVQALAETDSTRAVVDSNGKSILSKRETDIVHAVSDGLTNREIAARLQLSEHTIKNYLLRVFDKLGVSNRTELVSYVMHHRPSRRVGSQIGQDVTPSELPSKFLPV